VTPFSRAVHQDARHLCPIVRLFPFGASPISGQDIRIKKRYIV